MLQHSELPVFVQKRIEGLAKKEEFLSYAILIFVVLAIGIFVYMLSAYYVSIIFIACWIITLLEYLSFIKKMNRWKKLLDFSTGQLSAIRKYYYEPIIQMQKEYDEWLKKEPGNEEESKLKNDWLKMLEEEMTRKAQMIERL